MKLKRPLSTTLLTAGTLAVICVSAAAASDSDLAGLDLSTLMSMDVTLVTAQKRTEDVSTVPISMTVMKQRDVSQAVIDSTYELQQRVPGLTTSVTQGLMVPYIRGIGTENVMSIEPSVSVYIDDVYQTDRVQTFMDLADSEQIEVLKGPQGTLYGRNATGGAIKVTTRGPTDHPESTAQITAGNFDLRDARMFVAGPLNDRLRASFAAHVREKSSLYTSLVGAAEPKAEDFYSLHGRMQVDLTPDLEAELLVKHLDRNDALSAPIELSDRSIPDLMGIPIAVEPGTSASDVEKSTNRIVNTSTALKLNWNGPLIKLRSTTAYNELSYRTTQDLDGSVAPLVQVSLNGPSHAFTHEWQISPTQDNQQIDWMTGLFYIDSTLGFDPFAISFFAPGVAVGTYLNHSEIHTEAFAGFGEATVKLTEEFAVTAGLRYSHEQKSLEELETGVQGLPLSSYPDQSREWDKVSYRVVGKYTVGRSMLYAKTETAFKSGTFDNYNPTSAGPTASETITAYELGVKHGFADVPVNLSVAAFFNDYRNQQLQLVNATGTGAVYAVAPESRTQGIDAGIDAKIGAYWAVSAGFEWLDATYRRFASDGILVVSPAGGHMVSADLDVAGNHLSRAPEYTANLALSFDYPVNGGAIFGSANYYRSGRIYWDPANLYVQEPFGVLGTRTGYRSSTGWQISAWAKNLNDAQHVSGMILSPLGTSGAFAEPRTYGLTLQYDFGR